MTREIKILIVEDNVELAWTTTQFFESCGYPVMSAYDGMTALEVAKIYPPDVVLIDIGLPGLNGFVLARALQKECRKGPLMIAHSGYGSPACRRIAYEAGINFFFTKPADMNAIKQLIEDQLLEHD